MTNNFLKVYNLVEPIMYLDLLTLFYTNAEAITGLSTFILAIVTILLFVVNYKLWRAQDKPWLFFTMKKEIQIAEEPPRFSLHVQNIGKGTALDINLKPYRIIKQTKNYYCKDLDRKHKICCFFQSLYPTEERFVVEITRSALMEDQNSLLVVFTEGISYKDINGLSTNQKDQIVHYTEK